MCHDGWKVDGDGYDEHPRTIWKDLPDSEEIRHPLLDLLEYLPEHLSEDSYPIGIGLAETILWQLGEFGEKRAVENLEWVCENSEGPLYKTAKEALAKIQGMHNVRS